MWKFTNSLATQYISLMSSEIGDSLHKRRKITSLQTYQAVCKTDLTRKIRSYLWGFPLKFIARDAEEKLEDHFTGPNGPEDQLTEPNGPEDQLTGPNGPEDQLTGSNGKVDQVTGPNGPEDQPTGPNGPEDQLTGPNGPLNRLPGLEWTK
jgi:hypothetical protein